MKIKDGRQLSTSEVCYIMEDPNLEAWRTRVEHSTLTKLNDVMPIL